MPLDALAFEERHQDEQHVGTNLQMVVPNPRTVETQLLAELDNLQGRLGSE